MRVLFRYDFYEKRLSITFLGKSFPTLAKLSAYNRESAPSIFYNIYLFCRLSPPIFFKAFKAASLTFLSGLSLSICFNLYGSIPSPVSPLIFKSYLTNYSLYLEFLSRSILAKSGESIPFYRLARF
jgi:hypothetical protein